MFHWPLSQNYLSYFRVQSHLLVSGHSLHQLKWLPRNEFRFSHLNLLPSCCSVASRSSRDTRVWMNNLPTAIPAVLTSPLPQSGLALTYFDSSLSCVFLQLYVPALKSEFTSEMLQKCNRNGTLQFGLHLFIQQASSQVFLITVTVIVFAEISYEEGQCSTGMNSSWSDNSQFFQGKVLYASPSTASTVTLL